MRFFTLIVLLLILFSTDALTQDHTEGIEYMHNGQYTEASMFFKDQVAQYPKDLTAKICYYRSLGLGGEVEESLSGFKSLSVELPENEDILLNLAEAHLWADSPAEAVVIYNGIIKGNNNSKKANLGLALAYAKMEMYETSKNILTPMKDQYPTDSYLLTTYVDITKALAHQLKLNNHILLAISHLDTLISENLADRQALTARAYYLLENKEVSKAQDAFKNLLSEDDTVLDLRLALAYTYQLSYDFNKAYEYNLASYDLLDKNTESELKQKVIVANINTAILAKKNIIAKEMLDKLDSISTDEELVLNQNIQYLFSLRNYEAIATLIENNIEKYNLDKYKIRLAIETNKKLNDHDIDAKSFSSDDEELKSLLSKLNANDLYEVNANYTLAQDNESSLMHTKLLSVASPKTSTVNWRVDARHYNATTLSDQQVINHGINGSVGKSIAGLDWNIGLGMAKAGLVNESSTNLIGSIAVSKKLSLNQLIRLNVNRTNLTLNPSIISQNVSSQEIGFTYQLSLGKWHFYNKVSHSSNDKLGSSNRLFSDIAYHIKELPTFSAGLMTTILSSEDTGETNILPTSLKSYSTYLKLSNEYVPNINWKYILQSGVGLQQINGGYHHITSFLTAQLHYQIENSFSIGLQAKIYNNDVSGIYAYNFNSLGLNAKLFL